MIGRLLLGLLLLLLIVGGWFHAVGKGWLGGGPWAPAEVEEGPRPIAPATDGVKAIPQILFGDLHTHTNYSFDAYLFNSEVIKGVGSATPEDACDFARYCSALDFWSINDHAEGLAPRVWAHTLDAIRQCNRRSGDPDNPDMVSFVGWEWSNSDKDNAPSHYGHKNVIFRMWEPGYTPRRPIASVEQYKMAKVPALAVGLLSLFEDFQFVSDLGWHLSESVATPACAGEGTVDELPDTCREVATTPKELYRKLDEWGYDSLVIPHGLAWGTTNHLDADFRNQLSDYEQRYELLLESFSGHGNSERYEDFQRIGTGGDGGLFCPPATENFTPCCRRAGELALEACAEQESSDCEQQAEQAMKEFAERGLRAGRKLFPDASLDDWAGCGQLRNNFQPASMYVPRQSAQYNLALGFDDDGQPARAKFGLIGSSDNHLARPGNSYKETSRLLYSDSKEFKGRSGIPLNPFRESASFYYTGGLVAVHSEGRDRDSIWSALTRRQVYATSGDRMLVWFDLLNSPDGEAPMGSEVAMEKTPRFRVKALGALEQLSGCPEHAVAVLGDERIDSLCGGECFRPGDRRKSISRIEITRVRPQASAGETMAPLIEHRWRIFDCPGTGEGCIVDFDDPEYTDAGRSVLYYARVIQEAEPLIGGDPFGCEYDGEGDCIRHNYCIAETATRDENCTAMAEPRAWTSPIFLEFSGR